MSMDVPTRAPAPARRRRSELVNLSSNELHHPDVPRLLRDLFAGWDPADMSRYPVQAEPISAGVRLWRREIDEVLLCPGSDAGIRLLLGGADTATQDLVVQAPNYETWTTAPESGDWRTVSVYDESNGSRSLGAVIAAARSRRDAMVVVSWPNGPAGYAPELSELTYLRDVCLARGHLLVIDACYAGFSADPRDVVALAGSACLVLMSWSKMFALAGGRLAALFGDPARLAALHRRGVEHQVGAAMLAAFAATEHVFTDFQRIWGEVAVQRRRFQESLRERGVDVPDSGGNFLHVRLQGHGESARLTGALARRGYRVRDMDGVIGFDNCVRFTVAYGDFGEAFIDNLLAELRPLRRS
jgi:histidinol-phosphate aminotransferase